MATTKTRVNVTLSDLQVKWIDEIRGDMSRSECVRLILNKHLGIDEDGIEWGGNRHPETNQNNNTNSAQEARGK